jgi:hypothetical protein
MKILIIIFCLISAPAQAKFMLTASNIYTKSSDKNYNIPSQNTPSVSYGFFQNIKNTPISFSVSTNRLIQIQNKVFIERKLDGKLATLKTKNTTDAFNLNYRFKKHLFGTTLANIKSQRKINSIKSINHAILYGLNYSYILKKDALITLSLIAPNKELNLKGAGIASINLLF